MVGEGATMRYRDSGQRLTAAAIISAGGGVLFVALAAVTLTGRIAASGVMFLLLAAWNTRQLRQLPPGPAARDGRDGTPPDLIVG